MSDSKSKSVPLERVMELNNLAFQASRTAVSVVDAMSQRGAIKGEEMSAIGQLRDKCVALAKICEEFNSEFEASK